MRERVPETANVTKKVFGVAAFAVDSRTLRWREKMKWALLAILLVQWDFQADLVGSLPTGWQARAGSPVGVYRIEADPDGNRFLAARSHGSDVQLGRSLRVGPLEYPMLSWGWRVWELPPGADERKTKTMDSAAAVYAVFGSRLFPRILKYVWSTSAPAGASFKHPDSDRMSIIVVASGENNLGLWQPVSRNLVADYWSAFGMEPGNLITIAVKTDSDSTRTSARADYD